MTKEEQWKREAEIKLDELDDRGFDFDNWSISDAYERGYCDSAESREKRIAELEKEVDEAKLKSGYSTYLEDKIKIDELEKENAELKEVHESDKRSLRLIAKKGADLEKKISILLSCKNCPENKGGLLCQKEYEDKCLAQKIQYIKELEKEIVFQKNTVKNTRSILGSMQETHTAKNVVYHH